MIWGYLVPLLFSTLKSNGVTCMEISSVDQECMACKRDEICFELICVGVCNCFVMGDSCSDMIVFLNCFSLLKT